MIVTLNELNFIISITDVMSWSQYEEKSEPEIQIQFYKEEFRKIYDIKEERANILMEHIKMVHEYNMDRIIRQDTKPFDPSEFV